MTNFYAVFESVFAEVIATMPVEIQIPVHIDEGDEGTPATYVAGVVYDTEAQERRLIFNATSPWWKEGDLHTKMEQTIRHELRHLYQWQYIADHFGIDEQIIDFLMGTNELYGGYESNPYEIDAHRFETSTLDFEEGLEWIDQIVAH